VTLLSTRQRQLLEQVASGLPAGVARAEFLHIVDTQLEGAPTDAGLEAAIKYALDRVVTQTFLCCGGLPEHAP
jgi:hypothetical protein